MTSLLKKQPRRYKPGSRDHTEEYDAWVEEQLSDEAAADHAMMLGYQHDTIFPEDSGKRLADEGEWIILIERPLVYLSGFELPVPSAWFARPVDPKTMVGGGFTLRAGSSGQHRHIKPYKVAISTPGGELHLWPHEYAVMSDPAYVFASSDIEITTMGGEAAVDVEQLFFLMSRGIPKAEAQMLLLHTIKSFDFCYITFPEDDGTVDALARFARPLWRHIALNPRTKED